MNKLVSNSVILHSGITNLRKHLTKSQNRNFSTLLNSESSKVLFQQHSAKVFEFQLNNNKTLNAIDQDMVTLIAQQLKKWHVAPEGEKPKVVLISGTGEKAFCAGGDIVSLYHANNGKEGYDPKMKEQFFADEYLMDYSLASMSPLQISLWNGIVLGGGVGVSCHAPFRVATDNTMFAMPETGIGFFTDVGGSYFLPRIKNNTSLGMYLGLLGHRLKARDLVKWGVATHFVPADKIDQLQSDIINTVSESTNKQDIQNILNTYADNSAVDEPIDNFEHINSLFSNLESIHSLVKGLENHDSDFAKATLKKLSHMSPLSLGITFEQIKRGKDMTLKDVFEMEYKLSQGMMNHTEFFEGVRALLVDKDKSPKWKYSTVAELPQEEIEWFFNRDDTLNLDIAKY